jgi:iron complex transport system substrate-binding protein
VKKYVRVLAALLCALMLASCGAKPAQPAEPDKSDESAEWTAMTIKDDLDREVTLETRPERVAVLMGSFAETWLLAGGELIAAPKDAWEDFALDLGEDVVNLGSYQKISMEALFDLDVTLEKSILPYLSIGIW